MKGLYRANTKRSCMQFRKRLQTGTCIDFSSPLRRRPNLKVPLTTKLMLNVQIQGYSTQTLQPRGSSVSSWVIEKLVNNKRKQSIHFSYPSQLTIIEGKSVAQVLQNVVLFITFLQQDSWLFMLLNCARPGKVLIPTLLPNACKRGTA